MLCSVVTMPRSTTTKRPSGCLQISPQLKRHLTRPSSAVLSSPSKLIGAYRIAVRLSAHSNPFPRPALPAGLETRALAALAKVETESRSRANPTWRSFSFPTLNPACCHTNVPGLSSSWLAPGCPDRPLVRIRPRTRGKHSDVVTVWSHCQWMSARNAFGPTRGPSS
jgi:hypothetical protein